MAESTLKLTHGITNGICGIVCDGVLDAHTAGQLDDLIGKITKGGCHKLMCDLNKITYIASAGVGTFVGYVNACREKGGDLILVYAQGFGGDTAIAEGYNVLEVFNLLGLAEFITVCKTSDDAIRALSK